MGKARYAEGQIIKVLIECNGDMLVKVVSSENGISLCDLIQLAIEVW